MFRNSLLPITAWLGVLQSLATQPSTVDQTIRLFGVASVLGSLTVLVYRLGVWRQEMENTKENVESELKSFRAEVTASFARIEGRLDQLEGTRAMEVAR